MQYKYINHLNSSNDLLFCGDSAIIEIYPNFEYILRPGIENEEMEKWIENLENLLYIDKSDRISFFKLFENNQENGEIKLKDDKKTYKELFMLDTLSSYIIYQFIKGICEIMDDELTKNGVGKDININFLMKNKLNF
ncbi:hypothetical protein [Clostridium cochlearium]|uniref:hypothetical protein n=1 Tax=Clostridium cochlearium TaxID=1494 RepID=UPI00157100B7|nr:hypothetical protein [Clostridium cochlearium]MCG4581192.1 hypothetical protein [Clostridium cochlearium]